MIASPGLEQEPFKKILERLYKEADRGDGVDRIRQKAWQTFLELGLPSRRHEAYRHLKLRHLFSQPYRAATNKKLSKESLALGIHPEPRGSTLVFLNGCYLPECSSLESLPPRIELSSLSEAFQTFGTLLHNYWTQSLKEEADPFASLNSALHSQGAFLYLPPNTVVERPIYLLHLIDDEAPWPLLSPRLQLFLGARSELRLVTLQRPLSPEPYTVNLAVECVLDEGASLHYTQALCHEHPEAWHFDSFRATLKRHSRLKTVCATRGSKGVRNDYKVALAGEGAEALLNGIWMLRGGRSAHVHVLMDHQAPHCRSYQLFKGVLSENSRSSFEGKIKVRQQAQKSDAFQLNNNLLLDNRARADSKPNLEIFADDVKASHGSTVGQLDPEQLFYMKTRGCADEAARSLLVEGFCAPVLNLIEPASLRETLIPSGDRPFLSQVPDFS